MIVLYEFFVLIILAFFTFRGSKDLYSKNVVLTLSGFTPQPGVVAKLVTWFTIILPYLSLLTYIVLTAAGFGAVALLATLPIYVIYLWASVKKLPEKVVESGVQENLTKILSGEYRAPKKFFKGLWDITGYPFAAGIQGVMYYRMGNYKQAHKWFKVFTFMNGVLRKKESGRKNKNKEQHDEEREGFESLENPIEDIVFPSLHADALFRMGNLEQAETLWATNESSLKRSFVFLQADEDGRSKILVGDNDVIENMYLSLPEDETHNELTFGGTELADAILWWEGVSLSPYIFEEHSEEEEEEEVYTFDEEKGEFVPKNDTGASVVLENYTRLTISLLRSLYANTLFGLGFVRYIHKKEEEAEESWGTGVRHLGDRSCRRALRMTEHFTTVEEAFQQSLRTATPPQGKNENAEPSMSVSEVSHMKWLKNLNPNVASLYVYLTKPNSS